MTAALLLIAALSTPTAPVVVRARAIEFTTADVAQRVAELRAKREPFTPEALVEGLVAEAALAAEARRSGLEQDPDAKALLAYGRLKFVSSLYGAVVKVPRPTEAEARAAFHLREDSARLVTVAVASREEAAAVRARIEKGADIGTEALRSLDPSGAARRGDLGTLPRIVLGEALAAAVFSAPKGGLVGPIQSGNGWIVAKVLERTVGSEELFAAVRPQVEALLVQKLEAQARDHAVEMLRRKARISIDEAFLTKVAQKATPPSSDLDHPVLTVDDQRFRYREILPALRGVRMAGHGGSAMARTAVDDFASLVLLAREVRSRGLDRTRESVAVMERNDIHLLAEFLGRRILDGLSAKEPSPKRDAAFLRRLEGIKKQNDVWVDRRAALDAVHRAK